MISAEPNLIQHAIRWLKNCSGSRNLFSIFFLFFKLQWLLSLLLNEFMKGLYARQKASA
jgi:hypothetical protein